MLVGNHLGERSILNSYVLQSLSELHTSILLLLFYWFTLGQEICLGPSPEWLHFATDIWSPPFHKAWPFSGLTLRKSVKRSVIKGYFCERINALIKSLAQKKI